MNKIILVCALCIISEYSNAVAQQPLQKLKGFVFTREEGSTAKPIVGATVQWLGTTLGARTSTQGLFTIDRSSATTQLVVRAFGYTTDTIQVAALADSIAIELAPIKTSEVSVVEDATTNVSRSPIKTEVIGAKRLEQSACCSLAESFEKSPSVEVSFADAATGAKQIQLLGLRGIYTQTLVEAIPNIRGLATPFGLDYIPGAFIEGISIAKGTSSVTQGYEAITGQINIEYNKPQTSPTLFANLYGNHMGRVEANVSSATKLSEHTWGSVLLHGRNFSHEQDGNGDGWVDMPTFTQYNGVARVFHQNDAEGFEAQLFVKALHDSYNSGTLNHAENHVDHPPFDIGFTTDRYEAFAKACIQEVFGWQSTQLGVQLAASHHTLHGAIGAKAYHGTEFYSFAKAIFSTNTGEYNKLQYGASFVFDDFREQFTQSTSKRKEVVPGLFVENTFTGITDLTLITGIRVDAHNLAGTFITPRIHAKYDVTPLTSIRASVGSGMRYANVFSDNLSALNNNRIQSYDTIPNAEKAWNAGASFSTVVNVAEVPISIDAEFFRTWFNSQTVVDFDQSARTLRIGALQGESYSNSAMLSISLSPLSYLDISTSYRFVDVQTTTGGILQQRPLISPHRVLGTYSFYTPSKEWQLDGTLIWNSAGRVPSTQENPAIVRFSSRFPSFFRTNAQLTKRFENFDIYLGAENITNTIQQNPIVQFFNPNGEFYDGSLVWGPLDNRTIYMGIRWTLP